MLVKKSLLNQGLYCPSISRVSYSNAFDLNKLSPLNIEVNEIIIKCLIDENYNAMLIIHNDYAIGIVNSHEKKWILFM